MKRYDQSNVHSLIKTTWFNFFNPTKENKIYRYFWILGLGFGLFITFAMPPLMGFDEITHFNAVVFYIEGEGKPTQNIAHSIEPVYIDSQTATAEALAGQTQSKAINEGQAAYSRLDKYLLDHNGNTKSKTASDLAGDAPYTPVAFSPAIIGVFVAKLARVNLLEQIYIGRLFNLFTYLILIYLAIRFMPFGKWGIFVLGLLPMSLFEASTITADAFLTGLSFMYVALVLRLVHYAKSTKKAPRELYILLLLAGALIVLSKPDYSVILFTALLIPYKLLGSKRRKYLCVGVTLILYLLVSFMLTLNFKQYALKVGPVDRPGYLISEPLQLKELEHYPTKLITVPLRTIVHNGYDYFGELSGTFDPSSILFPVILSVPLVVVFALGANTDVDKKSYLNRQNKIILLTILLLTIALIGATLYLAYTPVGSSLIDGIQGRYFIPLLILLVPLLTTPNIKIYITRPTRFFVPIATIILIAACSQILIVNYWPHAFSYL